MPSASLGSILPLRPVVVAAVSKALFFLSALACVDAAAVDALAFCYEDWEPFSYVNAEGQDAGATIEAVSVALTRAGIAASFQSLPYSRCIRSVEAGRFDAILLTNDEPSLVASEIPTAYWTIHVVVHEADPRQEIASVTELSGARLGLAADYPYPQDVRAVGAILRQNVVDVLLHFRRVAAGDLDGAVADLYWARIAIQREGLALRALEPPLIVIPQTAMFNADRMDERIAYDAALAAFLSTGESDGVFQAAVGRTLTQLAEQATRALMAK